MSGRSPSRRSARATASHVAGATTARAFAGEGVQRGEGTLAHPRSELGAPRAVRAGVEPVLQRRARAAERREQARQFGEYRALGIRGRKGNA